VVLDSGARRRVSLPIALLLGTVLALSGVVAAVATSLLQLSTDPFTNTTSQHQTELEPDTFSFGSTEVSAFQVGRFTNGGASNAGFATTTNGGSTFTNGFLPGTTVFATPPGPWSRVSDPSVAFDAKHGVWLISTLSINSSAQGAGVIVNRSTDGGLTWSNPVTVTAKVGLDKDWIVCDDTSTSPFFGNCYAEWDDNGAGNLIHMSTSTDGGLTWGPALNTANSATGLGGQPLVQPNGTVIVPIANANDTSILAFTSTNGGVSWTATVTVSTAKAHKDAGGIRSGPLPSAEIDGAGKVYVVWQDCRFETSCTANDIVLSTSSNGTTWSKPVRIPIDAVGSNVDHFIPGIAVDRGTSGSTAHLALTFYFYPVSNCTAATCQLDVGYVSSTNAGTTWTPETQLAGPMTLSWLASTTQGRMVGDYISTSIVDGLAFPVFAVATAPTGKTFHETMNTVSGGLGVLAGSLEATSAGASSVEQAPAAVPATLKQQ
jgi:hypothetical protein